jgi:hypothetical protein
LVVGVGRRIGSGSPGGVCAITSHTCSQSAWVRCGVGDGVSGAVASSKLMAWLMSSDEL